MELSINLKHLNISLAGSHYVHCEKGTAMRKKRFITFIKIALLSLSALFIIGAVHVAELVIHQESIEIHSFDYCSSKINSSLDGFRIAFLTDIHIANQADKDRLERAIQFIEQGEPDLLLLGGDFSYGNAKQAEIAYQLLSKVKVTYGIYAVLGNHDLGESDINLMTESGIRCFENQGQQIVPGLYVGGVEDLWNDSPNIQRAISDREESDFVVLLSHNPDVVRDLDVTNVDLILSGHTHGGLVNVFGLWSPATRFVTKYGNRFAKGLVHDMTDIFISNGLGDTTYPRVFARRQINFITLRTE